ncbi:hypothetical protein EDS67_29300 [candidate division KSB1 bacterium]|nr:MAG: hypothetical protein EDS67_29300 [candidate division KSB1 bacterium]MBC6950667.1 hypothetical protein [candidate division KSB1 bacterium]MCE7943534.1 hypothetical protein [Chlorobi bacterium CHB1]
MVGWLDGQFLVCKFDESVNFFGKQGELLVDTFVLLWRYQAANSRFFIPIERFFDGAITLPDEI